MSELEKAIKKIIIMNTSKLITITLKKRGKVSDQLLI